MTDTDTLIHFLTTGAYLPAVGIALAVLVRLANLLLAVRIDWFDTRAGKYTLGFASAAILYVGAALKAGDPITLGLFLYAFGAGLTASGGWEALRDVLTMMKRPNAPVAVLVAVLATSATSCGPIRDHVVPAIIDCTKADAGAINSLIAELEPLLLFEAPDWNAIKTRAIREGKVIGGCVLADLVQQFLGGKKAPQNDAGWAARNALEDFRKNVAGGATFRTAKGDL